MKYRLVYSREAARYLRRLPPNRSKQIVSALESLAADARKAHPNWKRLKGDEDRWRLRIGAYRAICQLRAGELVVLVLKIGPRGDIY